MKKNGFTLIELLITLVLIVGVSLFGIGSYTGFLQKNEQKVIIEDLNTTVHYAKIQALIRGYPVFLSALEGRSDWSSGMKLVARDKKTKEETLVYQWQWNHPRWNLIWKGINSNSQIIFSDNPVNAMSNGKFILVNKDTRKQITIVLNRLGRLRMSDE